MSPYKAGQAAGQQHYAHPEEGPVPLLPTIANFSRDAIPDT